MYVGRYEMEMGMGLGMARANGIMFGGTAVDAEV